MSKGDAWAASIAKQDVRTAELEERQTEPTPLCWRFQEMPADPQMFHPLDGRVGGSATQGALRIRSQGNFGYHQAMRSSLGLLGLVMLPALAQEWPQFRGPNGRGVAQSAKSLPKEIAPDRNVKWRITVPPGHSSPVIWGDRLFLTAAEGGTRRDLEPGRMVDPGGKLLTISLNRHTGKIIWSREAPRPRLEKYQPANTPASTSPVTDGRSVFVFFGDFGLLSYDIEGHERWRLPLGPFNNPNGHGSSPILYQDILYLLCDQDTDSYLLAVDKDSGKVKWKVARPESTRSYSTPAIVQPASGPAELVVPGAYQMTSYDTRTGEKLWWVRGLSWQPKAAPQVEGDIVYAHWWESGGEAEEPAETPELRQMLSKFDRNGDGKLSSEELATEPKLQRGLSDIDLNSDGLIDDRDWNFHRAKRASRNTLIAVRAGGRGDVTNSPRVLWRMQKYLPSLPSPLLYEGIIYLIKDGGILTAAGTADGTLFKQSRLPSAIDTYYASPVAGAGLIYTVSQQGKATVIRAGADWQVVSSSDFGEPVTATPAIAGDRLYLRTRSTLYCFGDK